MVLNKEASHVDCERTGEFGTTPVSCRATLGRLKLGESGWSPVFGPLMVDCSRILRDHGR